MTMMNPREFRFTGWEKDINTSTVSGYLVSDEIAIRVEMKAVDAIDDLVVAQAKAISDRLCDLFDAIEQRRKNSLASSSMVEQSPVKR